MAKNNKDKGGLNGLPSDKGKGKGNKDKGKGKEPSHKGENKGRTFEVGGGNAGKVAIAPPGNWAALPAGSVPVGSRPAGLAPVTKPPPTGPKGTMPGTINPATGGMVVTTAPLGGKPATYGGGNTKGGDFDNTNKDKGGGGGSDTDDILAWQKKEAERARQEEKDRKNRINKGMDKINAAFAGFDDTFYDTREAKFKEYYMGQLRPEFDKARDNLTFALARAGLGTTVGTAGSTTEVTKKAENETDIANKTASVSAQAAADRTKTEAQIAAERSALVNTLNQTAQANQIGNEATAKVGQLATMAPDYQPMGDIFFGAAQGIGGLAQAAQNAQFTSAFNGGVGGNNSSGVRRGGTNIYG
jgi:hypothetical protein